MAEVLPCCWRQLSGLLWLAETNSITQAGYKAGMIYSMIAQSVGFRGIAPPNLHTSQKKHYKFINQSHTYSAEILGTHSCIHCSSRNSFTCYPSPGTCVVCSRSLLWWSWGWSQKSSSRRLDVFLGLTSLQYIETGHSHLSCIVPFFMFAQLTMKCWDVVLLP